MYIATYGLAAVYFCFCSMLSTMFVWQPAQTWLSAMHCAHMNFLQSELGHMNMPSTTRYCKQRTQSSKVSMSAFFSRAWQAAHFPFDVVVQEIQT